MKPATAPLLTPAEIAALYGKTTAHIHVLAHRHGWRRIKHAGRVYYRIDDAENTLTRRPA